MTLFWSHGKSLIRVRRGQCQSSQIKNSTVQIFSIVSCKNAYGHTCLNANHSFVTTKFTVGDFYYTLSVNVEKCRSPPNPVFDLRIQKPEEKYEKRKI